MIAEAVDESVRAAAQIQTKYDVNSLTGFLLRLAFIWKEAGECQEKEDNKFSLEELLHNRVDEGYKNSKD